MGFPHRQCEGINRPSMAVREGHRGRRQLCSRGSVSSDGPQTCSKNLRPSVLRARGGAVAPIVGEDLDGPQGAIRLVTGDARIETA